MSDSKFSSTEEDYDQIYLIFSKQKETSWPIRTNNQQTREKTVVMTRDEDDLSSVIFEARCTEEVGVNNWYVFLKTSSFSIVF